MTVREYIGARYVPLFTGDWDDTKTYEPLSIVLYQGNSYTSRQYVPTGIALTNDTYWAETGNFNAQVEAYREEVLDYAERLTTVEEKFPIAQADIADGAISTDKIYNGAVTGAKINDGTITTDKYAVNSITPSKLSMPYALCPFYNKKIVVYGDSTMVDVTSGSDPLWELIRSETYSQITCRAVGGTALSSFYSLLDAASASDFEDFDYMFIAYGTNDWQSGKPIAKINGDDSFEGLLYSCYNLIKTKAPHLVPVFITPAFGRRPFTVGGGNIDNINSSGATLDDYCACIMNFCFENNLPIIDLHHKYGINEQNYTDYMYSSGDNIYVHYSQSFKEKLARLFNMEFPFDTPYNPYSYGDNTLCLNNLDTNNTPTAAEMTVLENSTPTNAQSAPAIKLSSGSVSFSNVKWSGNDTIYITKKSSGDTVVVQIGATVIARVSTSGAHAIHVKGITSGALYFSTAGDVWVCNPQVCAGFGKTYNAPANGMVIKNIPAAWCAYAPTTAWCGQGAQFNYIHVAGITATSQIDRYTNIIVLPKSFFCNGWNGIGYYYLDGSGMTPIAVYTEQNSNGTIGLRSRVNIPADATFYIDAFTPASLVGCRTNTAWG